MSERIKLLPDGSNFVAASEAATIRYPEAEFFAIEDGYFVPVLVNVTVTEVTDADYPLAA